MPVRLARDVSTKQAEALFRELEEYVDDFSFCCSCPANLTCEVILKESGHGVYDLIVTRPRSVIMAPEGWLVFPSGGSKTQYERAFIRPQCADLVSAIVDILGAPLRIFSSN